MSTKTYSSPWQYFVETEANSKAEEETTTLLNGGEYTTAEHTEITLHITFTTLESTLLAVEAQTQLPNS